MPIYSRSPKQRLHATLLRFYFETIQRWTVNYKYRSDQFTRISCFTVSYQLLYLFKIFRSTSKVLLYFPRADDYLNELFLNAAKVSFYGVRSDCCIRYVSLSISCLHLLRDANDLLTLQNGDIERVQNFLARTSRNSVSMAIKLTQKK